MDSDVALDNVEAQARNTASTLAMVKRTMGTWATMTSTQPELNEVLERLRYQSTEFDSTIRKSMIMFKSSAKTAKQVERLLENIKTLDSAGLERMAESLAVDVKKTAREVRGIYDNLRDINSELAEISQDVTELEATFDQQKRETQVEYDGADGMRNRANEKADSARERKRDTLVGRGVGTAVLLGVFPLAIPLWWGVTTGLANKARKDTERYRSRAAELESELESLGREIKLLKKSEKKTRLIRKALPDLMEGFNSMYDFYVKIDTQVKDIRINPKARARLTYQQYARRWGQLHKQLEEHHTQITNGIEWRVEDGDDL